MFSPEKAAVVPDCEFPHRLSADSFNVHVAGCPFARAGHSSPARCSPQTTLELRSVVSVRGVCHLHSTPFSFPAPWQRCFSPSPHRPQRQCAIRRVRRISPPPRWIRPASLHQPIATAACARRVSRKARRCSSASSRRRRNWKSGYTGVTATNSFRHIRSAISRAASVPNCERVTGRRRKASTASRTCIVTADGRAPSTSGSRTRSTKPTSELARPFWCTAAAPRSGASP